MPGSMGQLRAVVVLLLLGASTVRMGVSGGQISGGADINLGHRLASWAPAMHIKANLSDITSIRSFFEFRTLDPEGTIFYGDTKDGRDWFVLSLRGGIPEMQIGKADILTSITGGPRLNDGVWHKLELRSEVNFVILEVDDKAALVVGLDSKEAETEMTGHIRLALGGLLVDKKRLFNPFNPLMDGCIKGGHWLNLSTPWNTDPTWESSPCFSEITRGSHFSGQGQAMFNTSDLPALQSQEKGISIEVNGSWKGTLLTLQGLGFQFSLTSDKAYEASKEGVEKDSLGLHEPSRLTFTILQHSLTINGKTQYEDQTQDLFSHWKEGILLSFGGVPGQNEDSHPLHGCLESIRIQGQHIDLDNAIYKHPSISSHSCPAKAVDNQS